jgi:catechol 2,3-dioxygenase-like lactoylglutathione lyase family enzyme
MRKPSPFLNVIVRRFAGAARRLDPRPSESLLSSPSIRGNAVAAPPAFSPARLSRGSGRESAHFSLKRDQSRLASAGANEGKAWPHEDCANEPSPLHCFGESRALWTLGAKVSVCLLLLVALAVQAAVREVGAIGLTVGSLDRVLPFYTNTLPFELEGISTASGVEQDALLGLSGTRTRSAELRLGSERITLTEHLTNKGRPIPADSRSFDHWFQHIAIVVRDMDAAYAHLLRHKVKHVSTAPQTLPAWNKDAGGIKAFYFRDPEDHVLEIIWFPLGKGDSKWQPHATSERRSPTRRELAAPERAGSETGAPLFLGIDHTAIVVSDTDRSLAFYTNVLGLRVVGGAENHGSEQEHLNQVFGARLRITALRAEQGPGIEFLEYIAPPGGRPLPDDAKANDLVFWTTELMVDHALGLAVKLRESGTRFVSRPDASPASLVRDPDGHALRLKPMAVPASAAR